MDDFTSELRIPEERVAMLIGKAGAVKKRFEADLGVKIFIKTDGFVTITGKDSLKIWVCEKIVKAVGRGFNPELAALLEKDDWDFEIIELEGYSRSAKDEQRLKGRVIGRDGQSKTMIEKLTGGYINVYGKTISVISMSDTIEMVRNAIEMLLKGARHVTVFKYLEKENQRRKREVMING